MNHRKNKKNNMILLLLVLLGSLGIGYALLTQELTINGTGKVNANTWDIHFENLVPNQNNVSLSTGDVAATINSTTDTDITYTVTLQKPGDFYEFTVDVVNEGSIDGMVGTVTSKLNNVVIDNEHPLPAYLNYSVTYSDGSSILPNHLLAVNGTETYKVRLEYKLDIEANDLPTTAQTHTLNFGVSYVQADSTATTRPIVNNLALSAIIPGENLTYGDSVIIEVSTDEVFEGQASVLVNQRTYTAPFSAGKAIVIIPQDNNDVDEIVPGGEHTIAITAIPSDLTQYYSIPTVNLTINIAPCILSSDDIKVIDQGEGTVAVAVPEDAEGVITLTLDENHIYNGTIEDGVAVIEIDSSVPNGQYNVVALFTPSNLNYTSESTTKMITILRD